MNPRQCILRGHRRLLHGSLLPPFPKEHELNGDLTLVEGSDGKASLTNTGNEGAPYLPGHPQVSLSNESLAFLKNEILTPELDILSPHLWLVAT